MSCTSYAVYSKRVYYGMNFDYRRCPMKFLINQTGQMKTFHLAFERPVGDSTYWANTAGMNTMGLFASCQELHPMAESTRFIRPGDMFVFELYNKINECSSVSEIVDLTNSVNLINLPGLSLHNLFADTHSRAIVTEEQDDENVITEMHGRFIVMTNFSNSSQEGKSYTAVNGKGEDQYKICYEYIENTINDFKIENGLEILKSACSRDPEYPTNVSMVFDPQKSEVFIALRADFSRIWKASLETSTIETRFGFKTYNERSLDAEGVMVEDMTDF